MARKGYVTRTFTLPDGTRKYIYGKTTNEAEIKRLQAKMQLAAGVDLTKHDTFGEFAQMWFNTFKRGQRERRTENQIKGNLNNHIMPYLSKYQMSKITPMQCANIFSKMTEGGKGEGVQRQVYQIMNQIFDIAVENGVIARSPMTKSVKPGGTPSVKRKSMTPAQTDVLLEAVQGKSLEPFVRIALGTGLRCGELYALHWDDVDMKSGEIHVHRNLVCCPKAEIHGYTKTDAGVRSVPFDTDVRRVFQTLWFQKNGPLVFHTKRGTPITFSGHQCRWNAQVKAAGIEFATAHTLRHTCITNWFDKGLDVKEVQYLAGHATATITMDIYTDYLTEKRYAETKAKIQSGKKHNNTTV